MNSPMPGKRQLLDPTPCGNLITGPAKKNYQRFVDPCGGGVPIGGVVFLSPSDWPGGTLTGGQLPPGQERVLYQFPLLGGCFAVADGISNSVEMGGSGVNLLKKFTRGRVTYYGGSIGGQAPEGSHKRQPGFVTEMMPSEVRRSGEDGGFLVGTSDVATGNHVHGLQHGLFPRIKPGTSPGYIGDTSEDESGVKIKRTEELHTHLPDDHTSGPHVHYGGAHTHEVTVHDAKPDWDPGGNHEHPWHDEAEGGGTTSTGPPGVHNIAGIIKDHVHHHDLSYTGETDARAGLLSLYGETDDDTESHSGTSSSGHAHKHGERPTAPDGVHSHTGADKHDHEIAEVTGTGNHYHVGGGHYHEELDSPTTPPIASASLEAPPYGSGDGTFDDKVHEEQWDESDKHSHEVTEHPHSHPLNGDHKHFGMLTEGDHSHYPGDPPEITLLPIERIY